MLCKSFKRTLWPVRLPTFLADFEFKILPSTSVRFCGLSLCLILNLFRQDETQFTIERRGQITDQIQRTCMVKHRQNERLQKTKIHRLINPNSPNSDSAFCSCSITFPSVQNHNHNYAENWVGNLAHFWSAKQIPQDRPRPRVLSVNFKIQGWMEKGF